MRPTRYPIVAKSWQNAPRACDVGAPACPLFTTAQAFILCWLKHPQTSQRVPKVSLFETIMSGQDTPGDDGGADTGLAVRTRTRTQRPPMYKVLLLNDDFTPMEFVVLVLERFFNMDHARAFDLMLEVHKKGLAVVGVFTHEIAETKVAQVMQLAREHQHPLQCTMERE